MHGYVKSTIILLYCCSVHVYCGVLVFSAQFFTFCNLFLISNVACYTSIFDGKLLIDSSVIFFGDIWMQGWKSRAE
jgi:hypothetical protein